MLRYLHHDFKLSKNPAENKIIFVDRDGVINVDKIGDYIKSWPEFRFEEGALEALKLLSDGNYQIIIISNQAGVGDGVFSETALKDIHEHMILSMEKAGIKVRSAHYCLHGKQAGCKCRKPETGLLEDAVKGLPYIKEATYFIGDKKTDVEAAKRFGIKSAFVRTGHGKNEESQLLPALHPHIVADQVLDAVRKILS